ncbi:MAG TPA: ATP-dependent DNA helicase RecG [bacterium]|jgi:ATP-dependent DNA helicase RecG|nr:ATP-dependent DNA helicase RecG [bacterium]HOG37979.1 ATP-dependent DNA helicase RecG [bacterium]HQI03038.1 ATP-dependent DNA helicase RecG [bacterium]
MNLDTTLDKIYGIGPTIYKKLQKIGLNTISDAIFYYPFRYEDFSHLKQINELVNEESATIKGKIILLNNKRSPRKKMNITEMLLGDDSGQIQIIWFNQPYIKNILQIGDEIFVSGVVKKSLLGLSLINPNYEKTNRDTSHTARIIPIYPSTEHLSQKQLRYIIKQSLSCINELHERLPSQIIKKENLIEIKEAIKQIHFPDNYKKLDLAKKRLSFDEIFLLSCLSKFIKKQNIELSAPQINFKEKQIKDLVKKIPFKLTEDQRKATWQILKDISHKIPMNRLLEGDVGSGKTIVSFICAYNVILNKYQAILMSPTQILTKQHFENAVKFFKDYDINILLFTNSDRLLFNGKKQLAQKLTKKEINKFVKKSDFIIGTHSLIQQNVEFKNIGLIIIDEQHRFGVKQRQELTKKSDISPHFLSMTATPIPRSLALTIYGDLDISKILQKPANRKKIITKFVYSRNRTKAYEFIYNQIQNGRQVFVVCPLINESDKLGVKSVMSEYEKLSNDIFPNLKIEYLHGKMKETEKQKILKSFSDNETKILVSTSVIEVGIDFPNVTIMIIEGADRFGLASLHQFRGRVGRGEHQSFCFLFSESNSEKSRKRLEILTKTDNGFELAEYDLKFRGSGDLYGIKQSGFMNGVKIADLSDLELIKKCNIWAQYIFEKGLEKFPQIKKEIELLSSDIHLE